MQIRVGGKYRTRDGRIATVVRERFVGATSFYANVSDDSGGQRIYCTDGKWFFSGGGSGLDLIAEIGQFEAGKYYRTRDGRKAYVASLYDCPFPCPEGEGEFTFRGWIDLPDMRDYQACGWTADGRNLKDGTDTQYDLIAPWKEPIEVQISDNYTAVVTDKVVVGCTEITAEKVQQVAAALKRYVEL